MADDADETFHIRAAAAIRIFGKPPGGTATGARKHDGNAFASPPLCAKNSL